jgi:signal transduction histidine kinase
VVITNANRTAPTPKLPPQVVLLLDDDMRVLDVNRGLAGTSFDSISADEQRSLHSQLHPNCGGNCQFNEMWIKAWSTLKSRGSIEWEVDDSELMRLLRLNLSTQPAQKNVQPDRRQLHKILTIKDITRYRREYESLVQRQRDLVKMLAEQGMSQVDPEADVTDFLSDTGSRLIAGFIDENHSFGRQLILAQENERKRIASELHDGISQTIGAVKFRLEASTARLAQQNPNVDLRDLREIVGEMKGVIEEIRRISNNLSPSILEGFGVQVALEILCKEFSTNGCGAQAKCTTRFDESETPEFVKTAIYRIVQEALNNVARHAFATRVDVSLNSTNEGVQLVISDDGAGVNLAEVANASKSYSGLGLRSIRERVAATGGKLTVESAPKNGFTISVAWPKPDRDITPQ